MSLLSEAMVDCVRLVEAGGAVSDGMGGVTPVWSDGEGFRAALQFEGSSEGRRAERDAVSDGYVVTVARSVALNYGDRFRRVADGAVFRVTSSGADAATPGSAGLDMRQARAARVEGA